MNKYLEAFTGFISEAHLYLKEKMHPVVYSASTGFFLWAILSSIFSLFVFLAPPHYLHDCSSLITLGAGLYLVFSPAPGVIIGGIPFAIVAIVKRLLGDPLLTIALSVVIFIGYIFLTGFAQFFGCDF
ncbi:MAG: hypothetical protein GY943_37520 [Chloroflexi bacterium]|nr:hypothetical protein [Chloroflexota bacterium]